MRCAEGRSGRGEGLLQKRSPEASLASDKNHNNDSARCATTTHARSRADVFPLDMLLQPAECRVKDECAGAGTGTAALRTELSAYAESFRVGRHGSGRSETNRDSYNPVVSRLSFDLCGPNVLFKNHRPIKDPGSEEEYKMAQETP